MEGKCLTKSTVLYAQELSTQEIMLDIVIFRNCAQSHHLYVYSSLAQVEDEAVLLVHRRRGEVDLPHFDVPLPLDLHARRFILESMKGLISV